MQVLNRKLLPFTLNNVTRGTIFSADLDGSNPVLLMDSANSVVKNPIDIELDIAGGKMYWTDMGWPSLGIFRANLDGTSPEQLVDIVALRNNYGTGIGQNLEYSQAFGLALDLQRGKMCWTDSFGKDIHCSDLNGAGITRVVPSTAGARGIDIDPVDGKIYWVTGNAGDVMRANADGTNPEQIVNGRFGTQLDFPMDLATDSRHLYFTDEQGGYVMRSNMDGSDVIVLHTLQYELTKKPGKFKNLNPTGIALAIDPLLVPTPVPPAPSPPAPAPAPPAVPEPVPPAPETLSIPGNLSVEYRADKGRWDISVPASTAGIPTTYSVIVFDAEHPTNTLTLLSGRSTNVSLGARIKGMTLSSQGLPETGSYVAVTVTAGGRQSAPRPVRMK